MSWSQRLDERLRVQVHPRNDVFKRVYPEVQGGSAVVDGAVHASAEGATVAVDLLYVAQGGPELRRQGRARRPSIMSGARSRMRLPVVLSR